MRECNKEEILKQQLSFVLKGEDDKNGSPCHSSSPHQICLSFIRSFGFHLNAFSSNHLRLQKKLRKIQTVQRYVSNT